MGNGFGVGLMDAPKIGVVGLVDAPKIGAGGQGIKGQMRHCEENTE